MFCYLIMLFLKAQSEWRLISSDFYKAKIETETTHNWKTLNSCTNSQSNPQSVKGCGTNNLELITLINDRQRIEKEFNYPHFQLRIITDVIYILSESGQDSVFQIQIQDSSSKTQLFKREYQQSTLQSYDNVCKQFCSGPGTGHCGSLVQSKVEIKTNIIDAIGHQNPIFKIQYCYQPQTDFMRIGLRNILIYVNSCHISCASCSGSSNIDCLSCYQGSLVGGICQCEESNKYTHLLTGCLQECPRDYYLAEESNYCQFDSRIQSKFTNFTQQTIDNGDLIPFEPWIFVPDPFHINNSNKIFSYLGQDYVGKFGYYESMQLRLPEHEGVVFLRIRVSFQFYGWQTDSVLRVTVDQYSQMRIKKTPQNYTFDNGRLNKFESSSCIGETFDILRIETVLKTYTTTPIIQFQGIQKLNSEFWSFNNVTIDYGLCQSNCTKCETFSKCLICESNYKLYRGSCVQQCPMYSQVNNNECIDYEDLIQNSRYLIKAFYDMNTTFEEVTKVVDNFTEINGNIKTSFTGAIYSFVPEKSVLGGVLVWNQGKFQKTFNNLEPHYKVSIRMNVTYGDENNGWFQLTFDSQEYCNISNPKNGINNLVGGQDKETTIFIEKQFSHSTSQLDIVLSADTQQSQLDNAFMYVSEYFVVVHYCVPFCSSCTGPQISDCQSGYTGQYTKNYCSINEYLEFNSATQANTCNTCNQLGCLECQSASICTKCELSDTVQFFLDQGECVCYPSAYLSSNQCLKCNRYCESCFGQNQDQCFTCNPDFHRSINEFRCQCLIGFYDDGYNIECQPICGDQLIVDGEDCDDGNSNPFDGCDQCRYTCQEECQNCLRGKCYQCKDGYTYQQATYKCLATCGNKMIQGDEQCDDGNDNIYDGCHLCKFKCDFRCINCQNGHCLKCDEENGWYLDDFNNCQNKCGDGIVAKDYEKCDDYNLNPFDLCDNCNIVCSEHCTRCENGLCLLCAAGFIFHNQTKNCIPICGDSVIVGNEQCEDQHQEVISSCQQCKFKCNNNCEICAYTECLKCKYGYYLINNKCEESCGDGFIAGDEQCDDYPQSIDGSCLNCRLNCGSGCLICNYGICEFCQSGYIREYYHCKPICGDNIIVDPEDCDDANLEPYDGCHFCQYSCLPSCLTCTQGVCTEMGQSDTDDEQYQDESTINCSDYCSICQDHDVCLVCQQYFQLSNLFCIPICGDGVIIPGLEQCEDGNDIPFDGCYQCQHQCSYGCIECEEMNKCRKCDSEQFQLDISTSKCLIKDKLQIIDGLDNSISFFDQMTQIRCDVNQILIDNVCINQCGNGVLNTEYEACDDGNYQGGDGCSYTCTIEDSYQCQTRIDLLSQCTYLIAPDFNLVILSNKLNSKQIIELTFSQQVKLQTDIPFEDLAVFNVVPLTKYDLIINPIQNLTTTLNQPKYQIIITFIEPVQDPYFEIQLAKYIILNEFDLDLQKYSTRINLGNPFVLSENTQAKLESIVKMNEATMYSMIGISSLAILTGNTIMFVNLLDLLQSLSYLRYMQYQFPPHLIEFLNTYTKVSLQPILDYFKLNELLMNLNGGTLPFQNNKSKTQQSNALNQLFLMNAKSCYFSAIASIFLYFTCCFLSSNRFNQIIFKHYQKYKQNGRFLKLIIFFQKQVQLSTFKFKNQYFSIGIFNVYQAILHQYFFSSLLQFPNYNFHSPFQTFNSLNAICSLLFISITSLQLLSITSSHIKEKQRWKYFYQDSKIQFWAAQYKPFYIYKTLFYIFIIVEFIEYPQVQSILLSMQSFYYFIYLIKCKPLKSPYEESKLKYREFLFLLITGSFLIYSFELSYDIYMLFGWMHIGMISLMLSINLIIDLFDYIRKAKEQFLRKQQKQKLKELQKYYDNTLQRFVLR